MNKEKLVQEVNKNKLMNDILKLNTIARLKGIEIAIFENWNTKKYEIIKTTEDKTIKENLTKKEAIKFNRIGIFSYSIFLSIIKIQLNSLFLCNVLFQ